MCVSAIGHSNDKRNVGSDTNSVHATERKLSYLKESSPTNIDANNNIKYEYRSAIALQ